MGEADVKLSSALSDAGEKLKLVKLSDSDPNIVSYTNEERDVSSFGEGEGARLLSAKTGNGANGHSKSESFQNGHDGVTSPTGTVHIHSSSSECTEEEMEEVDLNGNPVDDDEEDDLVVYTEGQEGENLTDALAGKLTTSESAEVGISESNRAPPFADSVVEELNLDGVDDDLTMDGLDVDDNDDDSELDRFQRQIDEESRLLSRGSTLSSEIEDISANQGVPTTNQELEDALHRGFSHGSSVLSHAMSLPNPAYKDAPPNAFSEVPLVFGSSRGGAFDGLVFCDTVDAMGRPVVVVNTSAMPKRSQRSEALGFIRNSLEPLVAQGPYVLVFTAFSSTALTKVSLPWVVSAYRQLSRPFKKNVQFVVLVRPNKVLKAVLKVMRLVIKKAAHRKIKQINYLSDIEGVTSGEVCIEHLSPKVLAAIGTDGIQAQ